MGQQEMYDFLKANSGKYFDFRQLSKELGVNIISANRSMGKLLRCDDIEVSHRDVKCKDLKRGAFFSMRIIRYKGETHGQTEV